ncbi:MAG: DUF92 domain-containing protein, partial [Clostridia bacterium]|nr:DUF92 domain-containing protein [Clostridia bacterium]
MILKGYLFGVLYGVLCLVLALVAYKLGLPKKYTRKIVHILVGFEWVILYHYLGATYHFLTVCLFFLALLLVAYFAKLMPMISSEDENSPGTVYYAVAMTGVAIVALLEPRVMLPFGIAIACTSIGDGFAGVIGQLIKKHNPKIYRNKSLFGSLANLLASFLSALILSYVYGMGLTVWHCLALALLAVGVELIAGHGIDNIAITWLVTATGYLLMYVPGAGDYILPIILTPFIIAFVLEKKALTVWGTLAAILMDVIVSIAFGNFGFVILVAFFGGSILVDKFKKRALNVSRADETAKRGTRDAVQVMANGLVATATACAFVFSKGNPIFAVAFVASMAEAFADTAASGLGAFSKTAFDPFRWRKCTGGISGGMSVIGTLAALAASFDLSCLAFLMAWDSFPVKYALIAMISAFVGTVFDSLL